MRLGSRSKVYCGYASSWTPKVNDHPNFYNAITQQVQSTIDAGAGGTLINKTEDKAYNLIEERTFNNH